MLYNKSYTLKSSANIQILLCYTNSFFKKKLKNINSLFLNYSIFLQKYKYYGSISKTNVKEGSLEGKVIVITGGGSGLGKAMTTYFLELGADVAITSRNLEKLQNVKIELEEKTGGKVLAVQCDVRNYDEVEAMLKATLEEYGKVDGLIKQCSW